MKNKINNYKNEAKNISCIGCSRESGELDGNDTVYKSELFDAHQDLEVPIPGFIIVSTRRHIQSIAEFTEEEAQDFITIMIKIRKAQKNVLGIDTIYLHQEEDTSHHFHFWMLPRYDWMKDKFGVKVESVRPIMEYAKSSLKTEENLRKVEKSLKDIRSYLN